MDVNSQYENFILLFLWFHYFWLKNHKIAVISKDCHHVFKNLNLLNFNGSIE